MGKTTILDWAGTQAGTEHLTTNREAAATLFVNHKTIEYHLGNVYRKLGVRSRTELANALGSEASGWKTATS